jgi:phasin family protein
MIKAARGLITFIGQRSSLLDMDGAAQYVPGFSALCTPEEDPPMPKLNEDFQKTTEEFQKAGKDNYDAMVRSYGELNQGFQTIAKRWTDFSKRSFEDATRAWEQLLGAKSFNQAFEIQTNYAKKAYENWMAEVSKIGEMYSTAARDAYKPVEKAMERHRV